MQNAVYIEGLGYRNPITESMDIVWFLEQKAKTVHPKRQSAFWNGICAYMESKLFELQAYELLGFLKQKAKQFQEDQRRVLMEYARAKFELKKLTSNLCFN
jgi:hypothetical protein